MIRAANKQKGAYVLIGRQYIGVPLGLLGVNSGRKPGCTAVVADRSFVESLYLRRVRQQGGGGEVQYVG
jgi:hypothetical protein